MLHTSVIIFPGVVFYKLDFIWGFLCHDARLKWPERREKSNQKNGRETLTLDLSTYLEGDTVVNFDKSQACPISALKCRTLLQNRITLLAVVMSPQTFQRFYHRVYMTVVVFFSRRTFDKRLSHRSTIRRIVEEVWEDRNCSKEFSLSSSPYDA